MFYQFICVAINVWQINSFSRRNDTFVPSPTPWLTSRGPHPAATAGWSEALLYAIETTSCTKEVHRTK